MALTDNLVAYYNLGTNSTDSVGSNNGTDTNVSYSAGAANFNGTSSKIVLGSVPVTGTGDMTYNLWFNTSSANRVGLFSMGDLATNNAAIIAFVYNVDHKLYFQMPANGGIASSGTVNDGNWHMATFILTGGTTGRLYLDGTQVGSGFSSAYNIGSASAGGKDIGISDNTYYFNGSLNKLGVWSQALDGTEITELYNSGSGLTYPFSGTTRNLSNLLLLGIA